MVLQNRKSGVIMKKRGFWSSVSPELLLQNIITFQFQKERRVYTCVRVHVYVYMMYIYICNNVVIIIIIIIIFKISHFWYYIFLLHYFFSVVLKIVWLAFANMLLWMGESKRRGVLR